MYNFEKKLNNYILTEAYKLETIDDIKAALQSNQIGVKISKRYDLAKDENSAMWKYVKSWLSRFLKNCDGLGIKDKTYGVQFLLSHCSEPNDLGNAEESDALYAYLQNYKKPWVKELPVYKQFIGSTDYDETLWHTMEKQIEDGLGKHGKANKGSGDKSGVKVLYQKDSNGWELLMPLNYQGEKAAAFYGKEGEKQIPTEWCTRCDQHYYDRYTDNNEHPLYIIRNWKTGVSYQIGFTKSENWDRESDDDIEVHFLDHKDVKGDEITFGNLEKIPNDLLKCIRIPFKTKIGEANKVTMFDYKNAEAKDPNEGKKGYADKTKTTFENQRVVDNKYIEAVMERMGYTSEQAKDFAKNTGGIVVSISKGGTFPVRKSDSMEDYFNNGQKTKNNYQPKAGIYRYSFKNTPNKYVEMIASKGVGSGKPSLNNVSDNLDNFEREILHYCAFLDLKQDIIKTYEGHDEKFIVSKKTYKQNANEAEIRNRLKKIHDETERECGALIKSAGFGSFKSWEDKTRSLILPKNKRFGDINCYNTGMPGRTIELTKDIPTQTGTRHESYEASISRSKPFKKEFIKIYDDDNEKITDTRVIELVWKIMQTYNKYWRKEFASEIIQNRQEGNYKTNMYEEVNYFEY